MCMVKFLRGWTCQFLGLLCSNCLLETYIYRIRITVVFYIDTVVGQMEDLWEITYLPGLWFSFLQNEGTRLDLLRAF